MRIFENLNYDFLGRRKTFYMVSAVLIVIGILGVIVKGFHFGIDFQGGTEIVLQFQKPISVSQIRGYVENIGLGNVELKTFGGETGILVRTELQQVPKSIYPKVLENIRDEINKDFPGLPYKIVDTVATSATFDFANADTTNQLVNKLFEAGFQTGKISEEPDNHQMVVRVGIADWIKINLREKMADNPFQVLREEQVGPKIGKELKQDAVIAVFMSLLVILIYLGFRFKFIFAVGAVVALFHDVIITLGLYAALYNILPINLDIDLTVVAAFLTLVGYSINDTVIVFDRVRENLKIHKTKPLLELMNMSINKTMSRTVLTGGTTLISVFILLLLGGDVLRAFAFTLFFGIIIGTYSSIFVASALVLEYANRSKKKFQF
ncbi:MAG: protein translocase subunit SecF [Ignavibacteriaceae bacterium]|nr:protein translocase subunit SecF [Ignavibacteriaceae bacterium]